jgi:WD40 repeat protein
VRLNRLLLEDAYPTELTRVPQVRDVARFNRECLERAYPVEFVHRERQRVFSLYEHPRRICAVSVSADGRRVLSASEDGTLKVGSLQDRRVLLDWSLGGGMVWSVSATVDRELAVSGTSDGKIKLWDLAKGCILREVIAHSARIRGVVLAPGGRHALSVSKDHSLRIWDLESMACVAGYTGDNEFTCCAAASDGRRTVVGDVVGAVHFLELVLPSDPIRRRE